MVLDGDVTDGGEEPTVRAQAQLTNSRPDAPLTRDDISPGVALKLLLVSCVLVSFTRNDSPSAPIRRSTWTSCRTLLALASSAL